MKTKLITKLKKEILIIELPEEKTISTLIDLEITYGYTLLGTPDEIKEEDVKDLVEQSIHTGLFAHYVKDIPVNTYCYKTALESFHSALESEIFWEDKTTFWDFLYSPKKWHEAQENTFDKKRTLIFVKN